MSLIKCSECGKKISDNADKCVNCGCPIQVTTKNIAKKSEMCVCLECENTFFANPEKIKPCPKCGSEKSETAFKFLQGKKGQIKCKKCKKWVSKNLGNCPNCNANLIANKISNIFWAIVGIGIIIGIIIAIIFCISLVIGNNSSDNEEANELNKKKEQCESFTDTYNKCSYSIWEARCVCKRR